VLQGALLFPARSRWIKWRMEANIALVSGLAILPSLFVVLASVSSRMNFLVVFTQKVRALITCLEVNCIKWIVIVLHPSNPIYLYIAWRLFGRTQVMSVMEAAYRRHESDNFGLLSCFWSFRLSRFLLDLYVDEHCSSCVVWLGEVTTSVCNLKFVFESCILSEFVTRARTAAGRSVSPRGVSTSTARYWRTLTTLRLLDLLLELRLRQGLKNRHSSKNRSGPV
jgi:hypothetical protein